MSLVKGRLSFYSLDLFSFKCDICHRFFCLVQSVSNKQMHFKELHSVSQGNKLASSIPFPLTDVWKVLSTSRRKSSRGDFPLIPLLGACRVREAGIGGQCGLTSSGWFSLTSRARGAARAGIPATTRPGSPGGTGTKRGRSSEGELSRPRGRRTGQTQASRARKCLQHGSPP